jgi:3-oxoacyl-[acyl-carrier protein] reductase
MNKKKIFLILGGSSDIGFNLISKLYKSDCFIIAHCNSNESRFLNFSKEKVKVIRANFSSLNDKNVNIFIKKIKKYDITYYVNLIGFIDNISYKNSNLNNLIKTLKCNTLIPNLILKEILKKMIKNSFGRILNCSSIGIKFGGGKNTYNYSFSKHALEFIPSYIRNLSKKNILINNLRIGFTNTKIHKQIKNKKQILINRIKIIPIGRSATIEEIVTYILFLVSEKNSFQTNETISVSGGE